MIVPEFDRWEQGMTNPVQSGDLGALQAQAPSVPAGGKSDSEGLLQAIAEVEAWASRFGPEVECPIGVGPNPKKLRVVLQAARRFTNTARGTACAPLVASNQAQAHSEIEPDDDRPENAGSNPDRQGSESREIGGRDPLLASGLQCSERAGVPSQHDGEVRGGPGESSAQSLQQVAKATGETQ